MPGQCKEDRLGPVTGEREKEVCSEEKKEGYSGKMKQHVRRLNEREQDTGELWVVLGSTHYWSGSVWWEGEMR